VETFAFLIHPQGFEDVVGKYKITKHINEQVVAMVLKHHRPFVISEITGIESVLGVKALGWLIVVPLLPWQFSSLEEDWVVEKIWKATEVAAKEGAKIVGLGAFTAIPGRNGADVAKMARIPVTTGNSYTIGTGIEALKLAAEKMSIDLKMSVLGIVGATGSIGKTCAQILGPQVEKMILIGRNQDNLTALALQVTDQNARFTTDLNRLAECDLIITVTSASDAIINPKMLKTGAVVLDIARPRDVSELVSRERDDVLVIDGGIVEIPGNVDFHFNFGLPPNQSWACMAETITLALEKKYQSFTIGKDITKAQVDEISEDAKKHGLKLAGLRSFEKKISENDIKYIARHAHRNRK